MDEYPKIDGYQILGKLGEGGMGCVYKARQISMDRFVAIKVIPNTNDESYLQRFTHEAKSVAALNHPNIVKAIDHGKNDKVHYFVMEFIEGINLYKKITKYNRILEKEALDIVLQVTKALNHAYSNNIIHRDIKPENILINVEGRILLCDLGLAKSSSSKVTQKGEVMGTPHYMSPEQCRGEEEVDTRSDIYSLGITLYHMITGKVPFDAPHPAAVCAKHISEPIDDPRKTISEISPAVVNLIEKMVAKNKEDRYQSPQELSVEIENILSGKSIVIKKPSFTNAQTYRISKVATKSSQISNSPRLAAQKIKRNRTMRTSSIQANNSKRKGQNSNIMVLSIVAVIVATVFLSILMNKPEVPEEKTSTFASEIKSLIEQKDLALLSKKINEYKKTEEYQNDEEAQNLAQQIYFYEQKRTELHNFVTKNHFAKAVSIVEELRENLKYPKLFNKEISSLEEYIKEKEKLQFESLIQNLNKNIEPLKEFYPYHYKENIKNALDKYENDRKEQQRLNKKQLQESLQKEDKNENDKNNVEPKEQIKLDPQTQKFLNEIKTATQRIANENIIDILLQVKRSLPLLENVDVENLRHPFTQDLISFGEAVAKEWVKFTLLDKDDFVLGLENLKQLLKVYSLLKEIAAAKVIEKPNAETTIRSFWENNLTKLSKTNHNNGLELYQMHFSFLKAHYVALEVVDANLAKELVVNSYQNVVEKIEQFLKRDRLSVEESKFLLELYFASFSEKNTWSKIPDIAEQKQKTGEKIAIDLKNKVEHLSQNMRFVVEVQEICSLVMKITNTEKKFYDTKRNYARIMELVKQKNYTYNFDGRNRELMSQDWQLIALKGKKKQELRWRNDFLEIPPGHVLFWRYPVTKNFTVQIRAFNPNHNQVRKNSKLTRWPENFGIFAFRSNETFSILSLFNAGRKHSNIMTKYDNNKEEIQASILQTEKEFPDNHRQPLTFNFLVQLSPLVIKIENKDTHAELTSDPLNGKIFIGIINPISRRDYPLVIQHAKISNFEFYTEEYLEDSDDIYFVSK